MSEKFRPESSNGGEKPKTPEAKKIEKSEVFNLTVKEVADHIASKPELQEKIFGKVLDEKELKKLEHGISSRIMMEVMESMNLRPLTLEELMELKKATPEEIKDAGEWMKRFITLPPISATQENVSYVDWSKIKERVRAFSVVDRFEEIKTLLARESPTTEELGEARTKFAEIEKIRSEYIEAMWGFRGPEEEKKALSGKLALGKGEKDEITLIAPSEFFEVKAKLEGK